MTVIAVDLVSRLPVLHEIARLADRADRAHAMLSCGDFGRRGKIVSDFDFQLLTSVGDLRQATPGWDELWQRSHCANPSARAEPLAQWIEHFAPHAPLGAVVVRSRGELVAALPLLGRGPRPTRIGIMPGNCWSSSGTLLVDSTVDPQPVLDCLIRGLRHLAWPLLRLDAVMPANPAWQQFGYALRRTRIVALSRPRCRVDQIDVDGDWSSYLAGRTYNHRRQIRRLTTRAGSDSKLLVLNRLDPNELPAWLQRGFAIEDQGWKGRAGTSVLKNPTMFDFFLRQARHFTETGELRLVFLEQHGRAIAFEYGWQGKGTYFPLKVAYDETVRHLSPGQLLRALLVERFFGDPQIRYVDFLGPSSRATHDFSTGDYPVARMLVAIHPLGAPLLKAYEMLSPLVRKFRGQSSGDAVPAIPPQAEAEDRPLAPVLEPAPA